MKILLNGLQLSSFNTGVQYYGKYLYSEFTKTSSNDLEIHLYQDRDTKFKSPIFRRFRRIFKENLNLPIFLKRCSYDLYHSPNYILPLNSKTKSVLTIHDLITFDYPDLCQLMSVVYFHLFLPASVKKADRIIVTTEVVKADLLKHFNIPSSKISVIPLGVNSIFRRTLNRNILSKYKIKGEYIFFVGNIEPKKNLDRLIKAYALLLRTKKIPHKLVISGKKGWKYKAVFKTVRSLKLDDSIIFTDYVPENDLLVLYSMADIFVFPSLYEGFGIPPLEAMACETPVMVSNRGALPETTGGNCLTVDPYDVEAIAKGMYRLITDKNLRMESIKKGKEWSRQFTWEKAAIQTIAVYSETMSSEQ